MAINSKKPLRAGARSLAEPVPAKPVQPSQARLNAAAVKVAADRVGWILAPGRAEQIAVSALPVINLFDDVSKMIDFDSDPLAFLAVRDAVKHREPA